MKMLFWGGDSSKTSQAKRKHWLFLMGLVLSFLGSVNLKGEVSLDSDEGRKIESLEVKDQKEVQTESASKKEEKGEVKEQEKGQDLSRSRLLSSYGWRTKPDVKDFCQLIRHTPVVLDLNELNEKCSCQELLEWGVTLVEETQKKFWNRQNGKERWEVLPSSWMSNSMQENFDRLDRLGFTRSVFPKKRTKDALKGPAKGIVCVLGATKGRMRERLGFLADLIKNGDLMPNKIVLLSGERFVIPGKDGSKEDLEQLAQEKGLKSIETITEMDILKDLCKKGFEKPFKGIEIVPIDVKATVENGKTCRPTTQSTVRAFISWLNQQPNKKLEDRHVFFISNQPYVLYQDAVIHTVFLACGKKEVCVQTLGNQISSSRDNLSLNSMQPLYEAFASYLWAKLLWNLDSLKGECCQTEAIDGFIGRLEALYKDPTSRTVLSSLQKGKD